MLLFTLMTSSNSSNVAARVVGVAAAR